jgi:hypothetical protein
LIEYWPLQVGLRFIFRESHQTVGAGVITELIEDDEYWAQPLKKGVFETLKEYQ